MKRLLLGGVMLFASTVSLIAQEVTQTVRGRIVDKDSQVPLIGATVVVIGSDPLIGAVTDENGLFRLTHVPIGRVNLKVTYIGYEDQTIPNLLVSSAKEEIVNIDLTESINKLDEIVIVDDYSKTEALNEMALISSHTFSVEETQRFAGSFDDPARMVSGFAGVNGGIEGNNDIVVRGNSPTGILWRLEGVAIPNPNHFSDEGSTGGPINALSSKMLGNSDFFTGAFAAEYGNVTSGVFDMKLKNGNNEKREYTAGISTLGLDMTVEGPFKQGARASYLANYRYSSLDLLDRANIVDFGGIPRYQDLSFKLNLPINNKHSISMFGLGGKSSITSEDTDPNDDTKVISKYIGENKLGVVGLTHMYQINNEMYLRSSLAATGIEATYDYSLPDDDSFTTIEVGSFKKSSYILASTLNYKVNARHKVETGIIVTRFNYNLEANSFDYDRDELMNELSDAGHSYAAQAFANWKFRIGEKFTMINGLHYLHFLLNDNYSIEPRVALKWQTTDVQSFNVGLGIHSKLEPVSTYLAKQYNEDGTSFQPNKDLELTKAAHFVVGYDNQVGAHTRVKVETYYQHLYNVPVENSYEIPFSLLNVSEGYITRTLVNQGTGTNYGLELTLDRSLYKGLYYMGTLSLFRSLYTGLDGVERKSTFDNNYVANLIGGKEFSVGAASKNKVFFVNTKLVLIGGKRYSPIKLEESIEKGTAVIDESNPFSVKGDGVFRLDFSLGLRRNRSRSTSEWKIDVQNVMNNQTVLGEYYVEATQSIENATQLGILPTISYKISF